VKIKIPYLRKEFPLEFPDENLLAVAETNDFHITETGKEILQKALDTPIGPNNAVHGISFAEFLKNGKRVLIIINDATRPTPTEAMLDALFPRLEHAGLELDFLSVLVATGAHRVPTEPEYHQILGAFYDKLRSRCIAHDSRREEDAVTLGNTRNGTPILLNKTLFEADRIIVTGSVEPHYFAGFTGGRKAFLPGIAAFRTIEANHKLALSPKARSLALEDNPVHEDMMDALPLIKSPVFSLMTVLNKDHGIAAAFSGDLVNPFHAAVEKARMIFCVSIPAKADIVVSIAKFPMDIDLYQSQKAIDNGALALKNEGKLILVSSCRDGIGDETYANLLAQASSPENVIELIRAGYKLGFHKAAKMAEVSARASIIAVSELSAKILNSMFIKKAASPQEALDNAIAALRARGVGVPKILIIPDGCVTVPWL
jgi:nickel-dependent lactate racemase